MGDDRRAMYEGFRSDGRHTMEWLRVTDAFVKHAFARNTRFVKCPCTKCRNLRFLSKTDMMIHLCGHGFMPNYLVWREHGEKEQTVKSDRNKGEEKVVEMLSDTGRKVEVKSQKRAPSEEMQKLYKLRATSNDKEHEDTDVTIHQALMAMKSKYKFSNQCYNAIFKLVTDLLPSKPKMPKDTANDILGHDYLHRQPSCSSAGSSQSVRDAAVEERTCNVESQSMQDAAMEERTCNAQSQSMRDAAVEERTRKAKSQSMRDATIEERTCNAEKRARTAEGHALQAYEYSKNMCMWTQQFAQNIQSQFNMPVFQPPFTPAQHGSLPMYPLIYPPLIPSGQAPPLPPQAETPQVSYPQACWPMYPPQSWQAPPLAYWPMYPPHSWQSPPPLPAPQKDSGGQSNNIK